MPPDASRAQSMCSMYASLPCARVHGSIPLYTVLCKSFGTPLVLDTYLSDQCCITESIEIHLSFKIIITFYYYLDTMSLKSCSFGTQGRYHAGPQVPVKKKVKKSEGFYFKSKIISDMTLRDFSLFTVWWRTRGAAVFTAVSTGYRNRISTEIALCVNYCVGVGMVVWCIETTALLKNRFRNHWSEIIRWNFIEQQLRRNKCHCWEVAVV